MLVQPAPVARGPGGSGPGRWLLLGGEEQEGVGRLGELGHDATAVGAPLQVREGVGPLTAAAATGVGLRVDIVAEEYSMPGLVEAIARHVAARPGGGM